jgi:pimeloyl-ACP methyl ester carboxylesterase
MIPIVLVPGLLCTAELFAPQIPALWPYGPVTVASTLEGETLGDMAAAILAAAPPRFALAGLSMGGYLAFEILRQAPGRVLKLALLDTSARPDTPDQTRLREALLGQVRTGDFDAVLGESLSRLLHPAHREIPALAETSLRMARTLGLAGLERQTRAVIGRPDSRPDLPAIAVPTLVLVGEDDLLTPPHLAREMADAIPGARLALIPRCGHASTLEQPDAVNRALVDWIGG